MPQVHRFIGASLVAALFACLLVLAPESRAAQDKASPENLPQVTISSIAPDAERGEVKIRFSAPVGLDALRERLRLLPPVRIDWGKSALADNILTLKADFRFGQRHLVMIPEKANLGGRAYVKTNNAFVMPDIPARVDFVEHKSVVERLSPQYLALKASNLERLSISSLRVPPLLLPLALSHENRPGSLGKLAEALKSAHQQAAQAAREVPGLEALLTPPHLSAQLFATPTEKNKPQAFSLPLTFRPHHGGGSLEMVEADPQPGGRSAGPRLFRVTDLGLAYKLSGEALLVWVTGLKDALPVAGVRLFLLTRDMEAFPLGQTGDEGLFIHRERELAGLSLKKPGEFHAVKRRVAPGQAAFVVAVTDADVSFMQIRPDGQLKPQGVWQAKPGEKPVQTKGHVFTERGVYQPGETVFFKGAVRRFDQGRVAAPQGLKCVFEVISSRGEKILEREATLNEFGTAAGSLTLKSHLPLGVYTLTLRFGEEASEETTPGRRRPARQAEEAGVADTQNQVSRTFLVQHIRPPRHFAEVSARRFEKEVTETPGQTRRRAFLRLEIKGGYYVGGPVKHGQARWQVHAGRTNFAVDGHDDFVFGYAAAAKGELIDTGQTTLDERGLGVVEFPLDNQVLSGRRGLAISATVLDFDGRSATSETEFQAKPDYLVGISRHQGEIMAGQPQKLGVMVLDPSGRPVSAGRVEAEILQQSGAYLAKRNDRGDLYWDYQEIWRRNVASDLDLSGGRGEFNFDFAWGGRYLVAFNYRDGQGRVFSAATSLEVIGDLFWEDYKNRDKPYQSLAMSADRTEYRPGQTARINLSPRRALGSVLVTLEREGLLEARVVRPGADRKPLEIGLGDQHAPNVYVSALGIAPRGEFPQGAQRYDAEAPAFYWGNLNLKVLEAGEALKLAISPEAKELKARPGDRFSLDLLAQDKEGRGVVAELAVAVVDESVMALTSFKTPTLESLARFDRPLSVYTGELRQLLAHQTPYALARPGTMTGGDGLSGGGDLIGKLRRRFDPVAYFNPAVVTGADGKAKVEFALPDSITAYRVYVVALDRQTRHKSAERRLVSSKDFYLEPGLPRFFTRGDSFRFETRLFNRTAQAGRAALTASARGGLSLEAGGPVAVDAEGSASVMVSGRAEAPGPAVVRLVGRLDGRDDAVEMDLRVNSGRPLVRRLVTGQAKAGEIAINLPPELAGLAGRPEALREAKAILTISGSPYMRLGPAARYLIDYGYGCLEQTASAALAAAALRPAAREGLVPQVSGEEVDKYLARAVERLLGLQTESGGFAYWPGQGAPSAWGSVYALNALLLAKRQGLAVPTPGLEAGLRYLMEESQRPGRPAAFVAHVCHLLAEGGKLNRPLLNRAARDFPRQPKEAQLLLILAAQRAGLAPAEQLVNDLTRVLDAPYPKPTSEFDQDFRAPYRGPALALLAAQRLTPGPAADQAAQYLLAGLGTGGFWGSTADTGWALLALSEYLAGLKLPGQPAEATLAQPGLTPQPVSLDPRGHRTLALDAAALLANPRLILTGAEGTWLYQVEVAAPLEAGPAQGVKIARQVRNTDGGREIKVGDMVRVTLTLDIEPGAWGRKASYLAVEDPLPAGLTAINTAFKSEEPLDVDPDGEWADQTADGAWRLAPNHFEMRDDRILVFKDQIYAGRYQFEYFARAVCQGEFVHPAPQAGLMYRPESFATGTVGRVEIKGR